MWSFQRQSTPNLPSAPPCHLFFFLVFQAKISSSGYFLRGDSKFETGDGKRPLDVNLCTITLSSYTSEQWVISYQWQRCPAEQAICIWHWSKQNIARLTQVKNGGREVWHFHNIHTVHWQQVVLLINIFIKKLMKVKNTSTHELADCMFP